MSKLDALDEDEVPLCEICAMDGPMDGDKFDYDELDPGVRKAVRFLRDHGFWTTDSGDGETKQASGQYDSNEVLDIPHIVVMTEPRTLVDECRRLMAVVEAHGIPVKPTGHRTALAKEYGYTGGAGVEIEASYDPTNDVAVLVITYLEDKLIEKYHVYDRDN